MRRELSPEIESQRTAGDPGSGAIGAFRLLCPVLGRRLLVVVSDGRDWGEPVPMPTGDELSAFPPEVRSQAVAVARGRRTVVLDGPPWEHVSVSGPHHVPTWAEMCWVKEQFWGDDECVVQYHPPKRDCVNLHPRCLHLWRLADGAFPMPPIECV